MRPIGLVAVGNPRRSILDALSGPLSHVFSTSCEALHPVIDARAAYHAERRQYHSTALLEQLARARDGRIVLGVTELDLFIPILTFVFGEAEVSGGSAVVSYHRLHQEFYGFPVDERLLVERTVKEAIHEIGHVLGLPHCDDYACVMAASHSVEYLDLKGRELCAHCRRDVRTMNDER